MNHNPILIDLPSYEKYLFGSLDRSNIDDDPEHNDNNGNEEHTAPLAPTLLHRYPSLIDIPLSLLRILIRAFHLPTYVVDLLPVLVHQYTDDLQQLHALVDQFLQVEDFFLFGLDILHCVLDLHRPFKQLLLQQLFLLLASRDLLIQLKLQIQF